VTLGLRLLGLAFVPLLATGFAMAFSVVLRVRLQVVAPGLSHATTFGSLVLVGLLSYRWTRRAWVAGATVVAAVFVTGLALVVALLWALSSVWG
jgi:hypothetical protein